MYRKFSIALIAGFACLMAVAANAQQRPAPAAQPAYAMEHYFVGENAYVRSLKADEAASTMWVGTSVGVLEVESKSGQLKKTFTRDQGLANEYVFAVGIDSEGYKWFGTNAGGASRYKDGKWKTYFPMHGLADYWIYAFANDSKGDLWIGTWAGANKFDIRTKKFTTYVKELINEWVYGIDVDRSGRIWFGTEGGMSMFDGTVWKHWKHKDGLGAENPANLPASPNTGLGTRSRHDLTTLTSGKPTYNPNYVFSVLVAKDGGIWAGTWGGGVGRFDGTKWTNFSTKDGLAGNIVYSIAQDRDGAMWFGTDKGVTRYDGKEWRRFSKNEGLYDDHVYAVAVTAQNDVWVGTRKGVVRMSKK